MTSPTKASANGMIQPVASPQPSRAATKTGSEGAMPQATTMAVDTAAAMVTQRYLPKRSPIGPTVTLRSAAICGSSESVERTMAWAANEASASSVMALVALPLFWDESGKVDTSLCGGLSTAQ